MRKRTRGREYALQLLYQLDVTRSEPAMAIDEFWTYHHVPPDVRDFATQLVTGTVASDGD